MKTQNYTTFEDQYSFVCKNRHEFDFVSGMCGYESVSFRIAICLFVYSGTDYFIAVMAKWLRLTTLPVTGRVSLPLGGHQPLVSPSNYIIS